MKLCRVCLNKTGIFNLHSSTQDGAMYAYKVMRCANIIITEGDGLPDYVCQICADDLEIAYKFVKRCQESDSKLRSADPSLINKNLSIVESNSSTAIHQVIFTPELQEFKSVKQEGVHNPIKQENQNLNQTNFQCNNENRLELEETDSDNSFHEPLCNVKIKIEQLTDRKEKNQCFECGTTLTHTSDSEVHLCAMKKDLFVCESCSKAYSCQTLLLQHTCEEKEQHNVMNTSRNNRDGKTKNHQTPCSVCGKILSNAAALAVHMRNHTGERPFSCTECGQCFKTKLALQTHFKKTHTIRTKNYICEMCGKEAYTRSQIIAHLRVHTGVQPYRCKYCTKSFSQVGSLRRHHRRHLGDKKYSCPICNKRFIEKQGMMHHMIVHTAEKNHLCKVCNKYFKTLGSLKTHEKMLHSEIYNLEPMQFICPHCGKIFKFKGNMQNHIRKIHTEKSGTCLVCLKTVSDLKTHTYKHTGEKPFQCKICNKAYNNQKSLDYHMSFTHKNATKYKCCVGECTKAFPREFLLEGHIKKCHQNDASFICDHCNRCFYRNSDLTRHVLNSHKVLSIKMGKLHSDKADTAFLDVN